MAVPALVFDLAGVLLDFRGPDSLHAMSDGRLGEVEFFRFWSEASCAHDIHCGRCSPEDFAKRAVREFGLNVTDERFLTECRAWFRGPYPGAMELLDGLRPLFRTACLSNAHELDVSRFEQELQLQSRFDRCFYSNEMGLRKPDAAAYLHVSAELDVPPAEIDFFDDSLENVNGARAVGMRAHHVTGFGDLQMRLRELGIWPPGARQAPALSVGRS
jgi:putative hydrolase of the HAD superfamily